MIFWVAWEAVETDDAGVFEKIKTLFMGAKFLLPVSRKKNTSLSSLFVSCICQIDSRVSFKGQNNYHLHYCK